MSGYIINTLYIAFICYALYRMATIHKRKRKRYEVMAKLVDKGYHRVTQLEFGVPIFYDRYEATFSFNGKQKVFEIAQVEYDMLEIGEEGLLIYEPYKVIAFKDKLKEFHFDEE